MEGLKWDGEGLAELNRGMEEVGVLKGSRQIQGFKGAKGESEGHDKEEEGWKGG